MKRDLDSLASRHFDVIVIGAGVHGACVARDAALRGLSVALIDKGDICGSTSHNSLKTIHGGIRYLQHLNFKRSLESINEQKYWLETAPNSVKPLAFLMPTYGWGLRGPIAMYIGIRLFELLGVGRNRRLEKSNRLRRGRILSKAETLEHAANIPQRGLTGGALWYDAQVEFADQTVLQVCQHAVSLGAEVANYVCAEKIDIENGKAVAVSATDQISGRQLSLKGKQIVNAAGPWAAELLQHSTSGSCQLGMQLPLTKSMNLFTSKIAPDMAVGVQSKLQSDSVLGETKRLYFIVPWQDGSIVGTTHFPHNGGAGHTDVDDREIAAFVAEINDAYPSMNLTMDEVLYCYQGLTPADGLQDSKSSRLHHSKVVDHLHSNNVANMTSIVSVKWTTARLVAEQAVDLVCQKLGIHTSCQTRHTAIPDLQATHGFCELSDGALVDACLMHMQTTMALTLSDMLLRRTTDLVTRKLSINSVKIVAQTMSDHYNWSSSEQSKQLNQLLESGLNQLFKTELQQATLWER